MVALVLGLAPLGLWERVGLLLAEVWAVTPGWAWASKGQA